MKRNLFVILFVFAVLGACSRDEFYSPYAMAHMSEDLHIAEISGIKLQEYIVEDQVAINIKLDSDSTVRVKLLDIEGITVSQEQIKVYQGDNILKVYVKALPTSSYTVQVSDLNGNVVGNQVLSKK